MGGARGRLIGESDRRHVLELIGDVKQKGCRKVKACEALGRSVRTLQRWEREGSVDRRKGSRAMPANRLSDAERARVLAALNAPAHCDKSPNQLVPMLADQGEYIASESTMYRFLREHNMMMHRRARAPVRIGASEQPTAQSQHCRTSSARQTKVAHRIGLQNKVAHRIGLQNTEQSRDNVPSLQGHRGLSDASERVGGTESRGQASSRPLSELCLKAEKSQKTFTEIEACLDGSLLALEDAFGGSVPSWSRSCDHRCRNHRRPRTRPLAPSVSDHEASASPVCPSSRDLPMVNLPGNFSIVLVTLADERSFPLALQISDGPRAPELTVTQSWRSEIKIFPEPPVSRAP